MKQRVMIGMALLLVTVLTGCDGAGDRKSMPENQGNVAVVPNEGRLIGQGRMQVDGHLVEVQHGRVSVDHRDYGSVPDGAEIYFRSNGDYRLLQVNGEERRPSRQNKN